MERRIYSKEGGREGGREGERGEGGRERGERRGDTLSLAHCMVCSMVAGKDLSVQYGTSLSGGSCCGEEDGRREWILV